jgi:hypothetical protein
MLFHPDYVREKIRASQLLNRLQKCAFGEISLTITQLRAIEILLRKSIPDLAAAETQNDKLPLLLPGDLEREKTRRRARLWVGLTRCLAAGGGRGDTQLVTEARSRFEGPYKSLQHQAQDWGSLTVKGG